ncbi:MAG: nitronate monooxygenase, partial [Alphaproteobacteria bacterium]|nr:nitronate monooxygenase [Alphaproteobacteria bacterium]
MSRNDIDRHPGGSRDLAEERHSGSPRDPGQRRDEGAVSDALGHDRLERLMRRGTDVLGCEVAIMGGAMSWISERHLVAALSNAGAFGVIACGAMTPALLDTEIAETRKRTGRPFGVNLITMHPQLSELIDVCAGHGVGHVVLAGGL